MSIQEIKAAIAAGKRFVAVVVPMLWGYTRAGLVHYQLAWVLLLLVMATRQACNSMS